MCKDPLYHSNGDVHKAMIASVDVMSSTNFITTGRAADLICDMGGKILRNVGRSPQDRKEIIDQAIKTLVDRKIFQIDRQRDGYVPGPNFSAKQSRSGKTQTDHDRRPKFLAAPVADQPAQHKEPQPVGAGTNRTMFDTTVRFSDR